MKNEQLVQEFIEQIWNHRAFGSLNQYLHHDFKDHSLPPSFGNDKDGLKKWVIETGNSFEHKTVIEDQVTEENKSVLKIRMELKHTGRWRDIKPTGKLIQTKGFRLFKIVNGKIIEHWALIDGQSIENQIKNELHVCRIAD